MPHRIVFAAVLAAICLPVLAVPAAAQVSIVPDQITGGGTQTFAFRVADARPDARATRLELVFPQGPPVAYVQVEPVRGWNATVHSRPLDPPVKAGDKTISEVAGTLVIDGGSVPPGQFEQFLVTMGPLPSTGTLVFAATQTFSDGSVAHWSPTINLGPAAAAAGVATAPTTAAREQAAVPAAPAPPAAAPAAAGEQRSLFGVVWGALGVAALVIVGVWWRARARRARDEVSAE